ncbi:MAG: exodeoxyribonuclease VII large subunit, partial [Gemmatimonadota bacterium]
SAVGHEVDVTIADLVADVRAPTPSAAAEYTVPDGRDVERSVGELAVRLERSTSERVAERRGEATVLAEALERAARTTVRARAERLQRAVGRLDALSPLAALRRGYAVPLDEEGRILRSTRDFEPGSAFELRVADGRVDARIEAVRAHDGEADAEANGVG